jgi:hypothetical protein
MVEKTLAADVKRLTVSATALNLTNRQFLLDSDTFGGTHYGTLDRFI